MVSALTINDQLQVVEEVLEEFNDIIVEERDEESVIDVFGTWTTSLQDEPLILQRGRGGDAVGSKLQ